MSAGLSSVFQFDATAALGLHSTYPVVGHVLTTAVLAATSMGWNDLADLIAKQTP